MSQNVKHILLGIICLLAVVSFSLWWFWEPPLVSPLSALTTFNFIDNILPGKKDRIVYGFLPYWNMDEVTLQDELTHLGYFGLTIDGDGEIMTHLDGGLEPGYRNLLSDELIDITNQVKSNTGQIEIVLIQFDNDDIVSFLSSPEAHENLLISLDSILLAYPVSGVNIDIEYTGEVTPELRNNLAALVEKLRQHLDSKYDHIQLSIDMYASAASKNQIWDVERIAKSVDLIVVMAYDFHRRSSPQAGPVAPLFGGDELWDTDINHHLKNFLTKVPRHKILLGVPFYGYEWQTTSLDSQAHTFPDTGATASFKRVQEILSRATSLNAVEHWNGTALSPYVTYTEDEELFVVYYENARSLSFKLDYVNQLDLAGIAIWALGYEGDSRELWEVINQKI